MKSSIISIVLLTNFLFIQIVKATDFLYYCDEAFLNTKVYESIISEETKFDLEEAQLQLTYNSNVNEASLQVSGEYQILTATKYDEESKTLVVSRTRGAGVGKFGVGYRFISETECDDRRAKLERFNIGGFAGGTVTARLNCVCTVD